MNAIEFVNATIGTVSSREDGSVVFRVQTPELRPSERGLVMDFHGKACSVTVKPHEGVAEIAKVETEREGKTPSQRFRAVLFVAFKQGVRRNDGEIFETYYSRQYAELTDKWKALLSD